MKNLVLLLLLLLFSFIATGQVLKDSTSRRGKLFLTVGTEYRITPIHQGKTSQLARFTLIDAQNSGAAFNYGFDFFVTKNLSLNFAHSIRYGLLTRQSVEVEADDVVFRVDPAEYTIISDYHFYADYHFKVFKQGELFVRAGLSFANNGTNVFETRTFLNNNNEPIGTLTSSQNYNYIPWNLAVGYKKNGLSLTGGVYTSNVTEYFVDGTSFTVPYISLKYNLFRF